MAQDGRLELHWNTEGWRDIELQGVQNWARPMCEKIAEKCNEESAEAEHPGFYRGQPTTDEEKRGYRAGTQTPSRVGWQLHKRSYHATVITATKPAMADNARHNRLVNNLHIAEGSLE